MGKFAGNFILEIGEVLSLIVTLIAFLFTCRNAKPGGFFPGYNGK